MKKAISRLASIAVMLSLIVSLIACAQDAPVSDVVSQESSGLETSFSDESEAVSEQAAASGAPDDVVIEGKYASVSMAEWDKLDLTYCRFKTPEAFIAEADGYFDDIGAYIYGDDWAEKGRDIKVDIQFDSSISRILSKSLINIQIDWFQRGLEPMAHEVTYSILFNTGIYINKFNLSLSEGFANYCQNMVSDVENMFGYDTDIHACAKIYLDSDLSPAFDQVGVAGSDLASQFDSVYRRFHYNYSQSFVAYLIETYGKDKFMKLISFVTMDVQYREIYGKGLKELKEDWVAFLRAYETDLDAEKLVAQM
ncbi:MAG: hypothetical protein LBV27_08800, partial [Oscillospiraceae bacterium]|nr:hypothetical protein [Oscillospiraceae bacterium]